MEQNASRGPWNTAAEQGEARICRESPLMLSGQWFILSRRTNGIDLEGKVR